MIKIDITCKVLLFPRGRTSSRGVSVCGVGRVIPVKNSFCWKIAMCLGKRSPSVLLIKYNWSTSDFPGHKASPRINSANTQPIAHTSTGVPYCVSPTCFETHVGKRLTRCRSWGSAFDFKSNITFEPRQINKIQIKTNLFLCIYIIINIHLLQYYFYQQFRCSVPSGCDIFRIILPGTKHTCESKIAQFYHAFSGNEDVLWLDISVNASKTVTIGDTLQNLPGNLPRCEIRATAGILLHFV